MEAIDKWVAEFFIRRQKHTRVSPTNLLSALKLGDSADCSNLKKTAVLQDISNSLIRGDVDEGTLDLLEILEKLLQGEGSVLLTESHKSAYCWTAAECTVRLMWPLSASEGLYREGLERIWTKRIGGLKESGSSGLVVSEELLKWEGDLRKAAEDPEVYRRIRETNVRYTAVCFLTQLLKEQWAVLGSSSLESVAQRWLLKRSKAADKGTRRLDEGEKENGDDDRDVQGVECPQHAAEEEEEERTMGDQEQEREPSIDEGDEMAATELKDYLLEIQRQIDPSSTRQVQEPNNANITPPQPSRSVNRTGTSGQQHDNSTSECIPVEEEGKSLQPQGQRNFGRLKKRQF